MFTLVRGVLLRPLPYPEPDRLVVLSHTLVVGGVLRADQSDATLLYYRRHNRAFARLGGYQSVAAAVSGERGTDAERVPAGRVTADLLPALGVLPLAGRVFSDADDRPGAAPVAVLSERLWARRVRPRSARPAPRRDDRRRSARDRRHHARVLGFPAADTELWLPLGLDAAHTESATFDYHAVGRLRNGVTIEAAADDLQALLPQVPDEFPGRMTRGSIEQTRMRATVQRLAEVVEGDAAHLLWIVFGAAAFVLAIACANVANLFLVRAEQRQQGIAIQRALGATPRVVMAEFACEALLVAAGGGAIGVGGAAAAIEMLRSLEGVVDVPRLHELSLDTAVIGAAVAMTAATALLITVVPAWRYAASTSPAPGAATQAATAGRNRHRARYTLIALQVALSLVLLVGSGLLARSMWRLRSVRPGFVPAHALTFRLTVPTVGYPDNEAAVRLYTNAVDAIAARPGVRHAAVVSKLPLDERGRIDSAVFVEDRPLAAGALPGIHPIVYATSDYFAAAGIPLVAGRTFARQDPPAVTLEAVVSSAFAERYWPGASPIGRRLRTLGGGPLYTIVGVAGDVRDAALDRPPEQMVYCPLLPPRQDRRWAPRDPRSWCAATPRRLRRPTRCARPFAASIDRCPSTASPRSPTSSRTHTRGGRSCCCWWRPRPRRRLPSRRSGSTASSRSWSRCGGARSESASRSARGRSRCGG